MRYARYFLISAALPVMLIFFIGCYIEPLSGDLTRLGKFAERDFGWRKPQPVLDVRPKVISAEHARMSDVVVLGDSFSERNVWQSVTEKETGMSLVSFHWREVETHACLERWLQNIKSSHPRVKLVVLQSIERMFVKRFGLIDSRCDGKSGLPGKPMTDWLPVPVSRDTSPGFDLPDVSYAIKAGWSSASAYEGMTRRGDVQVAPLLRTDLFSSRRSDLLLFYKDDLDKQAWTAVDLQRAGARIGALQAHALTLGIRLTVAVVPDKSSVYAAHLRHPLFAEQPPRLWDALRQMGVEHIDLASALEPASTQITDLYLPDDTHVGMHGYAIIGREVARWLMRARVVASAQ